MKLLYAYGNHESWSTRKFTYPTSTKHYPIIHWRTPADQLLAVLCRHWWTTLESDFHEKLLLRPLESSCPDWFREVPSCQLERLVCAYICVSSIVCVVNWKCFDLSILSASSKKKKKVSMFKKEVETTPPLHLWAKKKLGILRSYLDIHSSL